MKAHRRRSLLTAAIILCATVLIPVSATSAAAAKTVQTGRGDIDGDGHRDRFTVQLVRTHNGQKTFRVAVITARHRTVTTPITVTMSDYSSMSNPWVADPGLDGVAGRELVFRDNAYSSTVAGYVILTWRKGKLVTEAPPGDWVWERNEEMEMDSHSLNWITFKRADGHRYVDRCIAIGYAIDDGTAVEEDSFQRAMWRKGAWQIIDSTSGPTMDPRCESPNPVFVLPYAPQ